MLSLALNRSNRSGQNWPSRYPPPPLQADWSVDILRDLSVIVWVCCQVEDRDKRLDTALLQTGKYRDSLTSLLSWLGETEEMVSSQRPPSSEYKVAKAQIQEQKVSISSLSSCLYLSTLYLITPSPSYNSPSLSLSSLLPPSLLRIPSTFLHLSTPFPPPFPLYSPSL